MVTRKSFATTEARRHQMRPERLLALARELAGTGERSGAPPRLPARRDVVVRRLAQGHQSRVYTLSGTESPAPLVLKVAKPGLDEALERESWFLRQLAGRHAPRLVLASVERPAFACVEYVSGWSLAERSRRIAAAALVSIARDLSRALRCFTSAHPAILHRDISPRHVVVAVGGVVLLDFGNARHEGEPVGPSVPRALGSGRRAFQPPEQLLSLPTQDRRVDVFAAAAVLYDVVTGQPPYVNAEPEPDRVLASYRRQEPGVRHRLRRLPPPLGDAFMDALRAESRRRACNLEPLAREIARAFGGSGAALQGAVPD